MTLDIGALSVNGNNSDKLSQFFDSAKAAGLRPVGVYQKDPRINGEGWQNVASLHAGADGVGIITDQALVALDFDDKDTPDHAASKALLDKLLEKLPGAAVRRGDPLGSKWLVPVLTKAPCERARTLTDADGRKMQIIANRGQFVAFGKHSSRSPFGLLNEYSWSNGDALAALNSAPLIDDVIALAAELGFTGREPTSAADLSAIEALKPTDVAMQAMVKSMANEALERLREAGRSGAITGTAVMSTASRAAPAVLWGFLTEEDVVNAACAHGRDPDDNQGRPGRTYREEVERGLNNPLNDNEILEMVRSAAPAPATFDHIDPSQFTAAAPAQIAAPKGFELLNPLAFDPSKSERWIVKKLLRRGWVASVYAKPKAGKSTLVTDLAFHAATGRDWFGYAMNGAVPVLYITERPYQVRSAFMALAAKHGVKELPVAIVSGVNCQIRADDWRQKMDATLAEFEKQYGDHPGLIVFDTLAKLTAGADENSAQDAGIANQKLREVQDAYNKPAIITVGHAGKTADRGERGSNAVMGDRDVGIEVPEAEGDIRTARIAYANELESDKQIAAFKIASVHVGDDSDGEGVFGMVVEPVQQSATVGNSPQRWSEVAVIAELRGTMEVQGADTCLPGITGATVRTLDSEVVDGILRRARWYNEKDASSNTRTRTKLGLEGIGSNRSRQYYFTNSAPDATVATVAKNGPLQQCATIDATVVCNGVQQNATVAATVNRNEINVLQ